MTQKQLLKTVLVTGSVVLAGGVFLFTQLLITRLSQEIATTSRAIASFCAQASFPATRSRELQRILSEVVGTIDFPIVITDTLGTPRAWRRIDVDPALVPAASIDSIVAGQPIAPAIHARIERVRARARELDAHNPPVPMRQASGARLGSLHYGEPPVLAGLRWVPLVSVAGVVLLLTLGLAGLASIRAAERRTIWVGMAKETAHQLGTPLSSLMGWVELLRGHAAEGARTGAPSVPLAALDEAVTEMERDIERLNKVAQRFNRVGSTPILEPHDVRTVVHEVVTYMQRRVPQGKVQIREHFGDTPPGLVSVELLQWALENLIANSVSALDSKAGTIDITVEPVPVDQEIEITVRDSGRGMSPGEQKRAFEAGYTTKRRGWGLGLALARRVLQEYHRGRILIGKSAPGEGTTMLIRLKMAPEGAPSAAPVAAPRGA